MLPSLVRHGGTVVLHEIVMEGLGFFALKKDLADHVGELFPALAPLVERQQMQIQALSLGQFLMGFWKILEKIGLVGNTARSD